MERRGKHRVEMVRVNDKCQISAVFCGNALGEFLPLQLIYKGKSSRYHPRYKFPSDWNITDSSKHWSTEDTILQYIDNIILPYVAKVRDDIGANTAALVIIDISKARLHNKSSSAWTATTFSSHGFLPIPQTDCSQWMLLSTSQRRSTLKKSV